MTKSYQCWICKSSETAQVRESTITNTLNSSSFSITDYNYGTTAAIHKCHECGFFFCPEINDVVSFYEGLEDQEYETGRAERGEQSAKLLETIQRVTKLSRKPKLLDVGAGSGILIERAIDKGFEAQGVEPSQWLAQVGHNLGLTIHTGVLPHSAVNQLFDVVTLIDVIEHVDDPIALLENASKYLSPDGSLVVVTPDVSSFAARILGFRWWHYRVAHIGYFNKKTLQEAANRAGLEISSVSRPGWVFKMSYLAQRIQKYTFKFPIPKWMDKIIVPLNLFDSLLIVMKKSK